MLRDGRACLSNDALERQTRPSALGWKNYLFAGTLEGGRRAAIVYTLAGTAELNGWAPRAYLRVLPERLAGNPNQPPGRAHAMAPAPLTATAVRLRITLKGFKPAIWREVLVPASMTLLILHQTIQAAMGWWDAHLSKLDTGGRCIGEPDPDWDGAPATAARGIWLGSPFSPNAVSAAGP